MSNGPGGSGAAMGLAASWTMGRRALLLKADKLPWENGKCVEFGRVQTPMQAYYGIRKTGDGTPRGELGVEREVAVELCGLDLSGVSWGGFWAEISKWPVHGVTVQRRTRGRRVENPPAVGAFKGGLIDDW